MPVNPEDIQGFFSQLGHAVSAGNWRYFAALLVIAGVFYGGRFLSGKFPFFASSKGKAVLTIALSVLGGVATAFASGSVPSFGDLSAAIGVALTAAGGFSLAKPFLEK
jgi:hypothetical protein